MLKGLTCMKKIIGLAILIFLGIGTVQAQAAEVTVTLNEQFFDSLIDAIFKNGKAPEFLIAGREVSTVSSNAFVDGRPSGTKAPACDQKIVLQREVGGTRTAVRFRAGKITAPIAFTGSYDIPLIGCVDFAGVAETNINLEFNRERQALTGRAQVMNVDLNGTGGIGGSVIARLIQNSIDQKINPINILHSDKLTFLVPIQSSGSLKMKATNVRCDVGQNALNIHVTYEFSSAP
jgi:hypothetical protein